MPTTKGSRRGENEGEGLALGCIYIASVKAQQCRGMLLDLLNRGYIQPAGDVRRCSAHCSRLAGAAASKTWNSPA
eukprot:4927009-Pyramimonas_sp.AAC.3